MGLTIEQRNRLSNLFATTTRKQVIKHLSFEGGVCAMGLLYENHPDFDCWDWDCIPVNKNGQILNFSDLQNYYGITPGMQITVKNDAWHWKFEKFARWFEKGCPSYYYFH